MSNIKVLKIMTKTEVSIKNIDMWVVPELLDELKHSRITRLCVLMQNMNKKDIKLITKIKTLQHLKIKSESRDIKELFDIDEIRDNKFINTDIYKIISQIEKQYCLENNIKDCKKIRESSNSNGVITYAPNNYGISGYDKYRCDRDIIDFQYEQKHYVNKLHENCESDGELEDNNKIQIKRSKLPFEIHNRNSLEHIKKITQIVGKDAKIKSIVNEMKNILRKVKILNDNRVNDIEYKLNDYTTSNVGHFKNNLMFMGELKIFTETSTLESKVKFIFESLPQLRTIDIYLGSTYDGKQSHQYSVKYTKSCSGVYDSYYRYDRVYELNQFIEFFKN